ncbi:unnamed protein product, partial [Meganyctiphanes norvegica]
VSLCPAPFWPILNECFYAFTQRKVTWHEARKQCMDMGGDLAAPRRPVALTMYLKDQNYNGDLHLGGYKPTNGSWRWVSERRIKDDEWSTGEPNIHPQDQELCVHYWSGLSLPYVADHSCNHNFGFVCQYLF